MTTSKCNDTRYDFLFKPVTELFEEQVRKNPDRTAVIAGKESLTYEELNQRANRIAHVLIGRFRGGFCDYHRRYQRPAQGAMGES